MISNAADLLTAFIDVEVAKLKALRMPHMPTLGSAYEEIAKAGLVQRFALPPGLDLRVVSGFIEGVDNQFDAMLVQGPGLQYGLTEQYVYPIDRVLCVLEIKKTVTKTELADAIQHLASVQVAFGRWFVSAYESGTIEPDIPRAGRSFSTITGRKGPTSAAELDAMPFGDRTIIGALVRQTHAPVTVLFGFGGYGTERGLRKGLLGFLEDQAGKPNHASVDMLPTLITANSHSLIKCNHQPFAAVRSDRRWVTVASTRHNPARVLLELIWSKISNYCHVRMPWGDDMEVENLKELLVAEPIEQAGQQGWKYTSFDFSERHLARPAMSVWEPSRLSSPGLSLVKRVAIRGGSMFLDRALESHFFKEHGVELAAAAQELVDTAAFARDINELHVVRPVTIVGELEDGTGILAWDRGKLDRWCAGRKISPVWMTIVNVSDFQ